MVGERHIPFPNLLDHLVGRRDEAVAAHLQGCAACRSTAVRAERLIAAGQRTAAAAQPSRRVLRRADKIFRDARRPQGSGLLRLVLDTLQQPAPALRSTTAARRFLRFEGDVTVEIEVSRGARGLELRGQLTPSDHCREVVLVSGKVRRRARVDDEGTFLLRNVPAREAELVFGDLRITGLEL